MGSEIYDQDRDNNKNDNNNDAIEKPLATFLFMLKLDQIYSS